MHKALLTPHPMPDNIRKTALTVLNRIDGEGLPLDMLLDEMAPTGNEAPERDMRLLYMLVYGVLRWRRRLDGMVTAFSKTPFHKIDPVVRNILRLGLFQIAFLDRIPDSAAVNTSVELTKRMAAPHVAGFVNGLLRNAVRNKKKLHKTPETGDAIKDLGIRESFPDWLLKRWTRRYGLKRTTELCRALNKIPPLTIRVNRLKGTREALAERLLAEGIRTRTTRFSKDGLVVENLTGSPVNLTAYRDGWLQVQDEAAQLVGAFTAPTPGERMLDACAGLGGKTGHLAALMKNNGDIVALDNNPVRLEKLELEMRRLGITIVQTATKDLEDTAGLKDLGRFDRILVDAPCSGLGVLRRNPDAKWSEYKKDLKRFGKRQIRFLDALAELLTPAGRLVFSVCTVEPEENETVVSDFLARHPDFRIEPPADGLPDNARPLITQDGFFKTDTEAENMDLFFAAVLWQYSGSIRRTR